MLRKLGTTFVSGFLTWLLSMSTSFADSDQFRVPPTFIVIIDISGSMDDPLPAPVQPILKDSTKLLDVKRRLSLLSEHLPDKTRVIVTVFDHEAKQLCDLRLDSSDARKRLTETFASVKSRNGSTHLWRTADTELARAKTIVDENPEDRVRILLYTDGNDQERAPGLDHNTLVRKYSKALQSEMRLDFITLGFDVQADVKKTLEQGGVKFTKADTPDDIDPLIAGFKLSAESVEVGDEVSLRDESVGIDVVQRVVDWGDKTPYDQSKQPKHRFAQPGDYRVRYVIKTRSGRTNQTSGSIKVTDTVVVPAEMRVAKKQVVVGEPLRADDVSHGEPSSRRWQTSDGQTATSPFFEVRFQKPGHYNLVLDRTDGRGKSSRASEVVVVSPPPSPIAAFRFGGTARKLGDSIALVNESSSTGESFSWKLNGRSFSTEKHPTLLLDRYGKQDVELTVTDRWNQSHSTTQSLDFTKPETPRALFELPDSVLTGSALTVVDISSGEVNGDATWFLNEKQVGIGRSVALVAPAPGLHQLRLVVSGPGGEGECVKQLQVLAHAAPKAGFTIGNENPFVGDVIKITVTPEGLVDRSEFEILGLGDPIVRELTGLQTAKWFELPCSRAGTLTIKQTVRGPGGVDEHTSTVNIASRMIQPKADFQMLQAGNRGNAKVRFANHSLGTIARLEFDPGDGTGPRDVENLTEFAYTYGPGTSVPKIVAYPPEDSGLTVSTWVGTEVLVAIPTPLWVRNLLWQLPLGALAAIAVWGFMRKIQESRIKSHQRKIAGHLSLHSTTQPLDVRHFEFDGNHCEETVEFDSTKLTIRSVDGELVQYQLEIAREGSPMELVELSESGEATLGDYHVTYVA